MSASTGAAGKAAVASLDRMRLAMAEPGADIPALSDEQVRERLETLRRQRHAHPRWLHRPRADFGDATSIEAAAQSAVWLTETADFLDDGTPVGRALYDVLVNAASHVPDFGTIDGRPAPEPYGCTSCGGADGANACDTWESGIALAEAMLTAVSQVRA